MNQSLPVILLVFERPKVGDEIIFAQLQEKFEEVFRSGIQGHYYYRLITEIVEDIDSSPDLVSIIQDQREDLLLVHLVYRKIFRPEFTIQIHEFQESIFLRKDKKVDTYLIHGEEAESISSLFSLLSESVLPRLRIDNRIHTETIRLKESASLEQAKYSLQRDLFNLFDIKGASERNDATLETIAQSDRLRNIESVCIQFALSSSEWKPYMGEFLLWFLNDFSDESKLDPNGPTFLFFLSLEYDEAPPSGLLGRFRRNPKRSIQKALERFPQLTVLSELVEDKSIEAKLPPIFHVLQECPKLGLILANREKMTQQVAKNWSEQMGIPFVMGQLEQSYEEVEYTRIFDFYQLLFQQRTLIEAFNQAESTAANKDGDIWQISIPHKKQEDWTLPFSLPIGEKQILPSTVFLAFATDQNVRLPNHAKEIHEIREALQPVEINDLSDVYSIEGVNLSDVYDYFELNSTRSRRRPISIFHDGSQGQYQLLSREEQIGTRTYPEILSRLLGEQTDLKLVFLSRCGTTDHAMQLIEAGVPAVIATYGIIEDSLAVRMASSFYRELARGNTLQEAWERTEAEAKLNFDSFQGKTGRRSITKNISIEETEEFPWGLYLREENQEDILQWRLVPKEEDPKPSQSQSPPKVQANQVLIDHLREGIATHHPAILERIASENLAPQEVFSLLRNAFPYPIAESLRKLLSTNSQAFDESRLNQLLSTYHTAIELYISILFAQLYDLKQRNPEAIGILDPSLRAFFQIRYGIEAHQYLSLLSDLQRTFSSVPKEELPFPASQQFLDQLEEDSPVVRACSRLYEIKDEWEESKMAKASFFENKIPDYCKSAEEDFGLVLKELSFLSQYVFSSVGHIFVEQHYLTGPPVYQHELVSWNSPNSSALDMRTRRQSASTLLHSQSVYLMQDLEGLEPVLPLSPLLMMMDHEPSGRSESHQLYQFSHVHPSDDEFYIKVSANPTDMIAISAESDPERYAQAEAFAQLMFGCSVWDLRG